MLSGFHAGTRVAERAAMTPIALRAALGPVFTICAAAHASSTVLVAILAAGLLLDILDGFIARRLGVATARVRTADSRADLLFVTCVAAAAIGFRWSAIEPYVGSLGALAAVHLLSYLLDLIRYGRVASFHTWLAKAWGISLFAAAVSVFGTGGGGGAMKAAIALGFACNVEGFAIRTLIPEWTHDVGSVAQAWKMRRSGAPQMRPSGPGSCEPGPDGLRSSELQMGV